MARILVVSHVYDAFRSRSWMIQSLFPDWLARGHEIRVCEGPPGPSVQADVAILHVDCSQVEDEYAHALARFPVVVNGRGLDIRKSVVSGLRVQPGDDWSGPVIVKSELNCGGLPEFIHNARARQLGRAEPNPAVRVIDDYPIFASLADVAPQYWSSEHVVEKFMPEQDERGYWARFWLFFGTRGRCRRFCSPHPVVKAADATAVETVEVPAEILAVRERLGLDYGKIDFVMHHGRPLVVDVNRTPGPSPQQVTDGPSTSQILAPGLLDFLGPDGLPLRT